MRPKIDEHDFQVKYRMARRLLEEGDKVKVTIRFRGREMAHPELAMGLLERLAAELQALCITERPPRMEGRFMHMILAPREVLIAAAARPLQQHNRRGSAWTGAPPARPRPRPRLQLRRRLNHHTCAIL